VSWTVILSLSLFNGSQAAGLSVGERVSLLASSEKYENNELDGIAISSNFARLEIINLNKCKLWIKKLCTVRICKIVRCYP
jgi:hypothetical protein